MKNAIMKRAFLWIALLLLYSSCTIAKIIPFDQNEVPMTPDYSKKESWAITPSNYPSSWRNFVADLKQKEVDVFFIYPTLFASKRQKGWNSDIYEENTRKEVIELSGINQASAFASAGNVYMPFYRQSHIRIFNPHYQPLSGESWEIAYNDVKRAFEYYLKHYNQGKGIIIAGHSQGSMHAKRLLEDFFDQKPLSSKLVAAYLPGAGIASDAYQTLVPMYHPEQTGGFVSWNTYKKRKLPRRYKEYYQGKVVVNPIRFDKSKTTGPNENKGILYYQQKLIPQSLSIELIDGMVWSEIPRVPKRYLFRFVNNFHPYDINLFWKDISENAILRTSIWLANQQK